eukprot:2176233-Alexandrium_andersonii.AAC.1
MSASLVGSEMCIRDRVPRLGGHTPQRDCHQLPVLSPIRREPDLRKKSHACLLYTSDAADDM